VALAGEKLGKQGAGLADPQDKDAHRLATLSQPVAA
jgi:hypothetical protein